MEAPKRSFPGSSSPVFGRSRHRLTSVELGKSKSVFSRLVPQHRLKGSRIIVLGCRFRGEPAGFSI